MLVRLFHHHHRRSCNIISRLLDRSTIVCRNIIANNWSARKPNQDTHRRAGGDVLTFFQDKKMMEIRLGVRKASSVFLFSDRYIFFWRISCIYRLFSWELSYRWWVLVCYVTIPQRWSKESHRKNLGTNVALSPRHMLYVTRRDITHRMICPAKREEVTLWGILSHRVTCRT